MTQTQLNRTGRTTDASTPSQPSAPVPLLARLLIVHDDLNIRLRLAELVRPHVPGATIDTCGQRAAIELGPRLRDYAAAMVGVDFTPGRESREPLAIVRELRVASRALCVVVLGSQGNERAAVRALRAGAADYWPLHTIEVAELIATLRDAARVAPPSASRPGPALELPGYRVIKDFAQSPRAVIYLADSEELGQQVALKVHRHGGLGDDSREERERFLRECRTLSQINHRSIADVYDFGVTEQFHWLAMEYFPCGSLKARLQHPLSEPEAISYVAQLGEALAAVHAGGIVHRDLKPSNIMVRADDTLALIDFGLARPALGLSSVTSPNVRVGSPYYMAPEQIDGLPPDARCDLYALGVLFYELLTGRVPFAGQTVPEVLEQHKRARPPRLPIPVSRYQPLVDTLLAKRPTDRPASARAFLDALAAASPDLSPRSAAR